MKYNPTDKTEAAFISTKYHIITCPCCDREKIVKDDEELKRMQRRKHPDGIVCPYCWKVIQYFIRKSKRGNNRTRS